MMCQRIGFPPISIMGLGRVEVSSEIRVPRPPARMTAFIKLNSLCCVASSSLRCNFLNSGLGERDVRASLPLDRQVKIAQNVLCTSLPRRTLPDCDPCQSQSLSKCNRAIDEQAQIDHQPGNTMQQRFARLPAQAGAPIISVTHDRP